MNLNENLWSKLDLSSFGDLTGITFYDEPQVVPYGDDYNPLSYGNNILFYRDGTERYIIAHANTKDNFACDAVTQIYYKLHKKIDNLIGVRSSIQRLDPSRCGNAFDDDIIEMFGSDIV